MKYKVDQYNLSQKEYNSYMTSFFESRKYKYIHFIKHNSLVPLRSSGGILKSIGKSKVHHPRKWRCEMLYVI